MCDRCACWGHASVPGTGRDACLLYETATTLSSVAPRRYASPAEDALWEQYLPRFDAFYIPKTCVCCPRDDSVFCSKREAFCYNFLIVGA
jgi:hypothetical protein